METASVLKVTMTLNLLNGILYKHLYMGGKNKNLTFEREDFEKMILYSVMWGVGGLYEPAERASF